MTLTSCSFGVSDITSIVLAGGHSSRLGRDKSAELVDGLSLVGQVVSRLEPLSTEILLVISQRQLYSPFVSSTEYVKTRIVTDIYPEIGPLGGIYTGLIYSTSYINLTVACDMPFLKGELLRYMVDLASGFDAVVPRIDNLREPLHAVYTKNCLPRLEKMLKEGNLRIMDLLDLVKVRYVEKDEIERFDLEHLSFFNINTQADLEKARMIAAEGTLTKRHSMVPHKSRYDASLGKFVTSCVYGCILRDSEEDVVMQNLF